MTALVEDGEFVVERGIDAFPVVDVIDLYPGVLEPVEAGLQRPREVFVPGLGQRPRVGDHAVQDDPDPDAPVPGPDKGLDHVRLAAAPKAMPLMGERSNMQTTIESTARAISVMIASWGRRLAPPAQ